MLTRSVFFLIFDFLCPLASPLRFGSCTSPFYIILCAHPLHPLAHSHCLAGWALAGKPRGAIMVASSVSVAADGKGGGTMVSRGEEERGQGKVTNGYKQETVWLRGQLFV